MHGRFIGAAAVLACLACADQPSPFAPAIVGDPSLIVSGSPDNGQHPYVGLVVFDDANGPAWLCTGTLLSASVVLTAAHCTDGAVAARIFMSEIVQGNAQYPFGGTSSFEGTPHTHPDFCVLCGPNFGQLQLILNDVGIVVLSEPVPPDVVSSYLQLPSLGLASTLANGTALQLVGYGDQVLLVGGGRPQTAGVRRRLTTTVTLVSGSFSNSDQLIRQSASPAHGRGAACFGDSGGPNLLVGTHVSIAVNSYGSNGTNCFGVGYSTRIDRASILNWILGFLD